MANIIDPNTGLVIGQFTPEGPFLGKTQTRRDRAYVQILVDGRDVTNRLAPYLLDVRVQDGPNFEAHITLDDRDARLDSPPVGAPLEISLGWKSEALINVFTGWIMKIDSTFGRGEGGRHMLIHGASMLITSNIKTPFISHLGVGAPPGQMEGTPIPFVDMADQVARLAGTTAIVGPTYQSGFWARDYWSQAEKSGLNWFSRLADELGAVTRLENNKFVFLASTDRPIPNISAIWQDNLISWAITPYEARSLWDGSERYYFDHVVGKMIYVPKDFNEPPPWLSQSVTKTPAPVANATVARQENQGADFNQINWYNGNGHININGEPAARWLGYVSVDGCRPGVNGLYQMMSVTHTYSRAGYVSILEVSPRGFIDEKAATPVVGPLPAVAPNFQ